MLETKKENNELTIYLEGRLDTNTVPMVEGEMPSMEGIEKLVFDFEKVAYISSSGLRFILKYKKLVDNTIVINCNAEVYDVFQVTGFAEMMEVKKAYRKISIEQCEKIGEGFYGMIYRIDPETIVKVYKIPDAVEMIQRETALAKKAFVKGIPTAISYDIVKVGDQYGAMFELLNAESIPKLIHSEEAVDDFTRKSANLLKEMHQIEVEIGELPSRKEIILEEINDCRQFFSEESYQKIKALYESIPERNTMIHSDFHLKNIMMQNNELLLIDMESLSYGHPIFEFASMYASYIAFACIDKQNTDKFLGIPLDVAMKLFQKTFHYYYPDKTEEELKEMELKISMISYLQVLNIRSKYSDKGFGKEKEEAEYCAKYLAQTAENLETLAY